MSQSKYRQLDVRAPRGTTLTAKSWLTEAPLRMLMNNLDPDVAENPHELVVYGGIGRAARNWECYDAKGSANSVPAAAVIRRIRALSGFIGFKGCVGGLLSQR